ncbi:cyclin-H [Trichonephila inaurata madagascariensis]|uniref:Cyclin-H n=1 Tax=Trichonephila inaurata madagascariensis TaxID=2747483 RepID=A0A8X7C3C3_9ARAC|nr:cyclin-H [Trichonephila inaurata madagascariensis]
MMQDLSQQLEPSFPNGWTTQKYVKRDYSLCRYISHLTQLIKYLFLYAHIPDYFKLNKAIMFSTSAQAKSWMFKSSSELNKKREAANLKFIKERSKGMNEDSVKKFFLTVQEEKVLYKHYESILHKFCLKFQPPMPKNVVGCSFQYFKRFYLNNSVMDYHPKDIVVTCVYLASKVEEFNVSISQFVANVKGDRDKATEIILNHELLLMQQLNFDLSVYNPYRPVEGFLIDIKTRYTELFDPEHLRPAIEEFLDKIQFTDACFLYSPSQIALAAIAYGTAKFKESIDGYLSDILFDTMFISKKRTFKLLIPWGRYKRKLEEQDEDEDLEPAQKYSKLLENEESQMMEDERNLGVQFLNHK